MNISLIYTIFLIEQCWHFFVTFNSFRTLRTSFYRLFKNISTCPPNIYQISVSLFLSLSLIFFATIKNSHIYLLPFQVKMKIEYWTSHHSITYWFRSIYEEYNMAVYHLVELFEPDVYASIVVLLNMSNPRNTCMRDNILEQW